MRAILANIFFVSNIKFSFVRSQTPYDEFGLPMETILVSSRRHMSERFFEGKQRIDDESISYPGEYSIRAVLACLIRGRNNGQKTAIMPSSTCNLWKPPSAPRSSWQAVGDLMLQLRNPGTERTLAFWEKSEAPLPSQNVYEIFLTQSSSVLFLNVANYSFLYVTVLLVG